MHRIQLGVDHRTFVNDRNQSSFGDCRSALHISAVEEQDFLKGMSFDIASYSGLEAVVNKVAHGPIRRICELHFSFDHQFSP